MLPLIKIRLTYIKSHVCSSICTYLIIPIIALIVAIYLFSGKIDKEKKNIDKLNFDYNFQENLFYEKDTLSFRNYSSIATYLKKMSLAVNDETIGKELQEYIYRKTNIYINYYLTEADAKNNSINIIKLEYQKKDDAYIFKFIEKENEKSSGFFSQDQLTYHPFISDDLDTSAASSVFGFNSDLSSGIIRIKYINQIKENKNYVLFQSLLSGFLIHKKTYEDPKIDLKINYGMNSYPPSITYAANYVSLMSVFTGFLVVMGIALVFLTVSIQMVDEKEARLEFLLRRMGISKKTYFFSWLVHFLIVGLPTNISLLLFFGGALGTHFLMFFLCLILYNLAAFSTIYFLTVLLPSKQIGLIVIIIFNFGTYILADTMIILNLNKAWTIILNIFAHVNAFKLLMNLCNLEQFKRLSWSRVWLNTNNSSLFESIIMFIVEIIFYTGLGIFCKNYQESGLTFCEFISSLFKKEKNKQIKTALDKTEIEKDNDAVSNDNVKISDNSYKINHQELSEVNKSLQSKGECLFINNISKNYGDLQAVKNFKGCLFKDEIYCLLGHNGAGKTTLIKIISGEIDPNFDQESGIYLNNHSITTDKDYLYKNIGLCNQENIFFDYLTVEEQIRYMTEIKGSKIDSNEINLLIQKIGLSGNENCYCKNLSGGYKRKLCIALALAGNSHLVLLDEPTSGMDVLAKKSLWEFIKEYKKDKILILTTHSLDEAEYLGDRIGIMSDGVLICSGTSSFLKEKYPCGFNLNLLIKDDDLNISKKVELLNKIKNFEPNAEIKISSKGLLSINIPPNCKEIKNIFETIKKNKDEYKIDDYTVSSTSLEDVFLKLNHKIDIDKLLESQNENNENKNNEIKSEEILTKGFDFQLKSNLQRGFYTLWRNKAYILMELFASMIIVYIFIFSFTSTLTYMGISDLNIAKLLKYNKIYVYKDNKDYLINSYVTKKYSPKIENKIENINSLNSFIDDSYEKATANIAKGSIGFSEINENNMKKYVVYNTEVPMEDLGYFMADMLLLTSSFLKNEYNINAAILTQITHLGEERTIKGQNLSSMVLVLLISMIIISGFSIYLGFIMIEKIKERVRNIKFLLYLSGSNLLSYWIGYFIIDLLKTFVFVSIVCLGYLLVTDGVFLYWINLIIASFSGVVFIYVISFITDQDQKGPIIIIVLFFANYLFFMIIIILNLLIPDLMKIEYFYKRFNFLIFDITPISSLTISFFRINLSHTLYKTLDDIFINKSKIPDSLEGIYKPKYYILTSLMVHVINLVFYSLFLFLIEKNVFAKFFNYINVKLFIRDDNIIFPTLQVSNEFLENNNNIYNQQNPNQIIIYSGQNQINKYVQKEIDKVNESNLTGKKPPTQIVNLTKTYCLCCKKNVRAINGLYLNLEENEKFGLLGFNGSGKSTTFKSITNEIFYDKGEINLFNKNSKEEFESIRKEIGYCPQENPLFEYMTVKEIIQFYLDLKTSKSSVDEITQKFGLEKYLNTFTINLSGGNQRKLVFALACMNKPKILLLDEPSTGVDPESRRIMWKNINELAKNNHKYNMILSTHSMEEAEVLCDTVGWLRAGNFLCIGNPEKLKIEFSAGYNLHIKFNNNIKNCKGSYEQEIFTKIKEMIINAEIIESLLCQDKNFEQYVLYLYEVLSQIKEDCESLILYLIGKDYSFEFKIKVIKEKQDELFTKIFEMKNTNNKISEININMESLENILTRLN